PRTTKRSVMTATGLGPARLVIMVIAVLLVMGCSTRQTPGPATEPSFGPVFHQRPPGVPGRELYPSADLQGARWQRAHGAAWLAPLTRVPQARWINSQQDLRPLPRVAREADRAGELLTVVAYDIPDRGCSGFKQGAPSAAAY